MDSLGKNRGGLTKAVFERFRLLAVQRRAILVTVAYQPDVRYVFQELLDDGFLPPHAELLNYYEDQRSMSRPGLEPISSPHAFWELDPSYIAAHEPAHSGTVTRYFKQGVFAGIVVRNPAGGLRHVDCHDQDRPWIRLYRDTVWSDFHISRREYYDEENRPRYRVYVDIDGIPYLSTWINENGYEYRTVEHRPDGSTITGDTRGANAAWLERKLQEVGPAVVYTDEPRTTFALSVGSAMVHHVTSVHTTHYQNNMDATDGLKYWVRHYVQNLSRICRIVFFTETQRADFVSDIDCDPAITAVVSHAAPLLSAASYSDVCRSPQRLVSVSRLASDKRLDHAIRAFASVVKALPSAKFDIYGEGSNRDFLTRLISDLGVESSVTLRGHTSTPLECFAGAAASIVTSKYEGFGLVITESFSVETPVIAYDVIYGPRDVIESGSNGLLVADGDIEALGNSMREILSSESAATKLGQGARETAERFTRGVWADGWKATMKHGS